jgi:hypothetical protein
MFTPRAARRTDPRRLRRDHSLVVDAEIAAADDPSRPAAGRVPTLSCVQRGSDHSSSQVDPDAAMAIPRQHGLTRS